MCNYFKLLLTVALFTSIFSSCQKTNEAHISKSQQQNTNLDIFFDSVFNADLEQNPEALTYRGDKRFNDQWNDYSEKSFFKHLENKKNALRKANALKASDYSKDRVLSLELFKYELNLDLEGERFRHYDYTFNQMYGAQSNPASFLIGFHQIKSQKDAEDYISRVEKIPVMMEQQIQNALQSEKEGFVLPKFLFAKVLSDCNNLLEGKPISKSEKVHPIANDFYTKLEGIEMNDKDKKELIKKFDLAMTQQFAPTYNKLVKVLKEQEQRANNDAGVWRLKDGEEYYAYRLKKITSTNFTAEQIHQMGLREVARIHGEMKKIKEQVGFKGDLQEFFVFMKKDSQFYYPNTEDGKKAYLADATAIIDNMRKKLDELFITKPKAPIEVKKVEAFREKTAGKAFYNDPAVDGSRPGYYNANLYDMNQMPKYEMEALAYHEGIPGHHMQIALTKELKGLPEFRKEAHYTAYIEGWGLYAEFIPKELGFYSDPYSDFGRLAMELWRSCRLVVDTGIHAKKWTREEGIAYYVDNTPAAYGQCEKMVDRHIVMPGQATAYKIGMMKILDLKDKAKLEMEDQFDIRAFHEVVLCNGPLPLSILEKLVDEHIQKNTSTL
ncbi:DUF885 domain-containing protein [Flammeovirga aprica]|uniref:DUF885 domain-containing protein n=1 Tax=Flammeovirga aprica JL-4 TaxID=694437 RepID=A0A7X9P2E5_9BACT|nr:DUF885 domain-containing protein [Flammeovirga aprica]NME67409.1 DUF885 domain-containing protein [Flammeovirga aprica JL-4]